MILVVKKKTKKYLKKFKEEIPEYFEIFNSLPNANNKQLRIK